MKMTIKSTLSALDERVTSFKPIITDEADYEEYLKLADDGYILTDKWVLKLFTKKDKTNTLYMYQPVCTHIRVVYCQQDSQINERTYCVEIYNGSKLLHVVLDSSILTAQGSKSLLKHGCIYDENNIRLLLEYLTYSAYTAPIKYVHSHLGWEWTHGDPVFFTSRAICKSTYESEYIGKLDLIPKGTPDAWLDMVKAEVIGNTPLEFCLTLGFASIILGYINHYIDLGCLLFNLCNNSSKGKTTAAMLAASIFGNPCLEKGFAVSMNSTRNAIIGFASQASSHTIVFDEAASCDRKFFREVLYQLAVGSDKKRENTDGSMKEQKTFNSCIICTSEFPIIDGTAPNGIRARVFEINDTLTRDAVNSDNIKKCVYQNYGHAGVMFAEFIVIEKANHIMDDYLKVEKLMSQWRKKKGLSSGELTKRVLSKLSVILLTADYVNECFTLRMDIVKLIDYLLSLEQSVLSETDVADKALDCVMQYVIQHNNRFFHEGDDYYDTAIDGVIKNRGRYKEIVILKPVVEQILICNGFENVRDVYKKWSEKKLLSSEKDRPYKRLKLIKSLPAQPCFVFCIAEEK